MDVEQMALLDDLLEELEEHALDSEVLSTEFSERQAILDGLRAALRVAQMELKG